MRRLLTRFAPRRPAPVILMYHCVAAPARDTWSLCVSPDRFRDQLAALRDRRTPVSATALVAALDEGRAAEDAVALTFDDGYVDNLVTAKPLLEAAGVPATVYLATGWIDSGRPYWWDELETVLFDPGVLRLDLDLAGERITMDLTGAVRPEPAGWRFGQRPRTARQKAYVRLWTRLRDLSPDRRAAVMDALRGQTAPLSDHDSLPMSAAQAGRLGSAWIDVGAHGVTHAPMTILEPGARRAEIVASRREAARLTVRPVDGFAYPHGDRDPETRAMVRDAGYRYACSTVSAAVNPDRYDRFDLPRLMVLDWTGAELIARIEALRP